MRLYLYVFDADAEASLLEEFTEREEAVMACQELVAVDGYPRAEVWNGRGDRLYGVARQGGSLRSFRAAPDVDTDDGDDEEDAVIGEIRPAIRIVSDDSVAAAHGTNGRATNGHGPNGRGIAASGGPGGELIGRIGRGDGQHHDDPQADDADELVQPDAPPPQPLLGEQPGRREQWFGI